MLLHTTMTRQCCQALKKSRRERQVHLFYFTFHNLSNSHWLKEIFVILHSTLKYVKNIEAPKGHMDIHNQFFRPITATYLTTRPVTLRSRSSTDFSGILQRQHTGLIKRAVDDK